MKKQIYIALLRGINVGGHNILKMEVLRKVLQENGFESVKTYIQSGNIIFKTEKSKPIQLIEKISEIIEKEFDFKVPVIVLTIEQLKSIILDNPYLKESSKSEPFMHVTFLSDTPNSKTIADIVANNKDDDELRLGKKVLYLYCPNSYSKSKLVNTFLEKKLKLHTTTRNWKTTLKLLEIAEAMECN